MNKYGMIKSRLTQSWIIGLLTILLVMGVALPAQAQSQSEEMTREQLQQVLDLIERYHVSGTHADTLNAQALQGVLESLNDPYTEYMSAETYQAFLDSMNYNYVGIGIQLNQDAGGIYIVDVFPDTPAQAAGLLAGDYIRAVNGLQVTNQTVEQLVQTIKGKEGTKVRITVERHGERFTYMLKRSAFQLPILESRWFDDQIAYLRLFSFSAGSAERFKHELSALLEKKPIGVILDLRSNPGGYLLEAAKIAGNFMESGPLMYTKNSEHDMEPLVLSDGAKLPVEMVVLVDQGSASASEVFSGAIQDYGLATIMGQTTYGKGSVQQLVNLADGSVLKVTVEEYFTPKRNKVDHVGITPDVEVYGEWPQLLGALQHLGSEQLHVTLQDKSTVVNGSSFNRIVQWLDEGNEHYVPLRLLAAVIGAEVSWNPETEMAEVLHTGRTVAYARNKPEVRVHNAVTLVAISQFAQDFPTLSYQADTQNHALTLSSVLEPSNK